MDDCCINNLSRLGFEKKMFLAFQIETRAGPDEAGATIQRKGCGDPTRVSYLQVYMGAFSCDFLISDTFGTWACHIQKHQDFNFYAFIHAHYFLISNIRIFHFLEDNLFLQVEILGKQNPSFILYILFIAVLLKTHATIYL